MLTLQDVHQSYASITGPLPSLAKLRYRINCWSRFCSENLPITFEAVEKFKALAQAGKLSATTINDTIADLVCMLRATKCSIPETGRRLKEEAPLAMQPSLTELDALYAVAKQANWPARYTAQERCWWWQGWITLSYHWPFRVGDLIRLRTTDVIDKPGEAYPRVQRSGSKTQAVYAYPLTDVCRRHLANLRCIAKTPGGEAPDGSLFMLKKGCVRFVRAEMKRLSKLAGISEQTPQSIRRCSLTSYSCLGNDCGQLAHHGSSGLGVRSYYVSMVRVLSQAIDHFEVPESMLDQHERIQKTVVLKRLSDIARRLKPDQIQQLARMAEVM